MNAAGPLPWTWPGLRELVPAAIVALIVLVGGRFLEAFPARVMNHVQNAYRLELARLDGGSTQLQLSLDGAAPGPASAVTLYQDDTQFRQILDLTAGSPTPLELASEDTGHYYQARSVLPGGNLALSNAVWVPSDRLVTILIDASPWANATVQGNGVSIGPEPTPMTAQLMPGQYSVRLDNGGLTSPLEQTVEVSPTSRTFRFTMPGFDATTTAGQLIGGQTGR